MRRLLASIGTASVLLGGVTACTGDDEARIVVTTNILGDVVRQIAGEQVTVLMKPNADPHSFAISAREAHTMRTADLIVYNGLGLEEGVLQHVEAAVAEGVPAVEVGARVEPLEYRDGDAAGLPDPHFWTDPVRMVTAVDLLTEQIVTHVDGVRESAVRERAAAYQRRLQELDADLAARFGQLPAQRRVLVTNHHVFGYLAARYDFAVVGAILPSGTTLASPSASDLASLVSAIETHRVPAVFADTAQPARLAEVLAAEAGLTVRVVGLYSESLSDVDGAAASYLAMMRFNADAILGGLSA
ncbi:zinc ABC transporter substrate-binding protein AztC [Actinoplanes derwentensis]|uniref:Zinc/manganese transport system substrate-binding protein n=1 Tax=Actinoplanes derwentensis TaxID=113562 RepID=A0A1H1VG26_9ACTN|nr:zinc ABC transporter substrate-binding protein AztC [Actinoplanes derwentensis]GID83706.1 ABC transporter substrate-binding protein [Actinoplanes derwentensis]SDS83767.1 zinc/manganese transport system substrate-binding protein [Actinoplanes derwentensis]